MKTKLALLSLALTTVVASAQTISDTKFAIKPTADFGLGNTLSLDYAIPGLTGKDSSANEFGIDFGFKIWQLGKNSLEANIGVAFGKIPLTLDLAKMDYHYDAPAEADMDNEPYIRYYELAGIHQEISTKRLSVPLYVNYKYQICKWVGVHAMLGYKFGVCFSPVVSNSIGNVFSYGVYPQYDNLMIDAPYMNGFGETSLSKAQTLKPQVNSFTSAFLVGAGAEVAIWGPLSVDVSLRFEGSMNNIFKGSKSDTGNFDAVNAPVTYTVATGQQVKPLSHYLTLSQFSRLSLAASLIYRF